MIDVLRDESEYARRSAVEVLNEIADPSSIKYLLKVLGDADDHLIERESKNDDFSPGQTETFTLDGGSFPNSISQAGQYYLIAHVHGVAGGCNRCQ